MSGFLLTPEERHRFVDYCRREAESLEGMAKQIGAVLPSHEAVAKDYRMRAAAYAIVAGDLDKVEDVSIGGDRT